MSGTFYFVVAERSANSIAKKLFNSNRSQNDNPLTLEDWASITYDSGEPAVAFNYAEPHTMPSYATESDVNVEVEVEIRNSGNIPDPLPELAHKVASVEELMEHLDSSHFSPADLETLENATRDQSSTAWTRQRAGRIGK